MTPKGRCSEKVRNRFARSQRPLERCPGKGSVFESEARQILIPRPMLRIWKRGHHLRLIARPLWGPRHRHLHVGSHLQNGPRPGLFRTTYPTRHRICHQSYGWRAAIPKQLWRPDLRSVLGGTQCCCQLILGRCRASGSQFLPRGTPCSRRPWPRC